MSEPLDLEAIKADLDAVNYRSDFRIARWYRRDVPALVTEVERLRDERDELIAVLNSIPSGPTSKDVADAFHVGRGYHELY